MECIENREPIGSDAQLAFAVKFYGEVKFSERYLGNFPGAMSGILFVFWGNFSGVDFSWENCTGGCRNPFRITCIV